MTLPRILVVGGNFAGIAASRALAGRARVTVVDPSAFFEWLPNVHELVSGFKSPHQLRAERRRIVTRHGNRFVETAIEDLDAHGGTATTSGGRRLRFDACIVAVGGVNDTYGVPGADRHALPFKSVEQCHTIGRRLAAIDRKGCAMRITIVGGGLEGVEALGEILRHYRRRERLAVTLVESGRRLMPGSPPGLHSAVREQCERHGVRLLLDTRVIRVTAKSVLTSTGERLASEATLWTGGVRPPPCLQRWELTASAARWAEVDDTLASRRVPGVLVAGDAAEMPRPLAKQAYHALDMGTAAAGNALAWLAGRPLERFEPSPKPQLVAFGDLDTYLVATGRVWASPALAWVKEAVFQATMAQIDPPTDRQAVSAAVRRALPPLRQAIAAGMKVESLLGLLRLRAW